MANGTSNGLKSITPNTSISIALAIFIVGGVITIYSLVSDLKTSMAAEIAHLQNRVTVIETKQQTQRANTQDLKSDYIRSAKEVNEKLEKISADLQKVKQDIVYIKAKLNRR